MNIYKIKQLFIAGILICFLAFPLIASPQDSDGIKVSEPKIYDNRTLQMMLESLERRLSTLAFINQESLSSATGRIQGGRRKSSFFDISLSPPPAPTTQTTSTETEGTVNTFTTTGSETVSESSEGITATSTALTSSTETPSTSSSVTQTVTEQGSTPQIPPVPSFDATFSNIPTFGLSARDLLVEQLSLTYQIMNLRLAIERSLSDRYINSTTQQGIQVSFPKRILLLGFQISIDQPVRYKNAMAEVQIELNWTNQGLTQASQEQAPKPSLLLLLPTRNTYNVVSITQKSQSIGLGLITQVLQIGATAKKAGETYYIVQDTDTLGLEFNTLNRNSISFGWRFRPVLGRHLVEPGMRHVYAVIALPDSTLFPGIYTSLKAEITTKWRKWKKRSGAVGKPFSDKPCSKTYSIDIPDTSSIAETLSPQIHMPKWYYLDPNKALVVVDGENFFSDTKIVAGSTVLDVSSGLIIPNENRLYFRLPPYDLFLCDNISIIGTYGPPQPLITPGLDSEAEKTADPKVEYLGNNEVEITFYVSGYGKLSPIVIVDKTFFGSHDRPIQYIRNCRDHLKKIKIRAPLSVIHKADRLIIKEVFGGPKLRLEFDTGFLKDPLVTKTITIAKNKSGVRLAIYGANFDNNIIVEVGKNSFKWNQALDHNENFMVVEPTWDQIHGVDYLVIKKKDLNIEPVLVKIDKPILKKPKFVGKVEVPQGYAKRKMIKGENFNNIKAVEFQGKTILHKVEDNGQLILTLSDTHVTAIAGPKEIEIILIDGSKVYLEIEVKKNASSSTKSPK